MVTYRSPSNVSALPWYAMGLHRPLPLTYLSFWTTTIAPYRRTILRLGQPMVSLWTSPDFPTTSDVTWCIPPSSPQFVLPSVPYRPRTSHARVSLSLQRARRRSSCWTASSTGKGSFCQRPNKGPGRLWLSTGPSNVRPTCENGSYRQPVFVVFCRQIQNLSDRQYPPGTARVRH